MEEGRMDHRSETRSPIVAWLRNEHAGARYDEPYPSGEPTGAEEGDALDAADALTDEQRRDAFGWLADIGYPTDRVADDMDLVRTVGRLYDGGWGQFIEDGVPVGTPCQLCDEPATVAVPFADDDGMNMVECTAYVCDEHARRLDADEPMHREGDRR